MLVTRKLRAREKAIEEPAPISPYDAMVKKGNSLPVEYWAHPF